MKIQESTQNDIVVFTIDGRVDSEGAVDLDLGLQAAATDGKSKMILDLSNVKYINSAGLRTLADILTRNREEGGDLKLASLHPKVLRVLQIIGFDKFFSIYDSVASAQSAFANAQVN
jgi:anti-anti-sigma factor